MLKKYVLLNVYITANFTFYDLATATANFTFYNYAATATAYFQSFNNIQAPCPI
jgi:hypothetical protein